MVIYNSFISLNLIIAPWVGTFVALPVQINWKKVQARALIMIEPRREKTCLRCLQTTKGADQPAHPRRLISA